MFFVWQCEICRRGCREDISGKRVGVFMNEVTSSKSFEHPQKPAMGVSLINTLIGIWLIVSTFVMMAFNNLPSARWNNVIVGILVGLFGAIRASGDTRACWSWAN